MKRAKNKPEIRKRLRKQAREGYASELGSDDVVDRTVAELLVEISPVINTFLADHRIEQEGDTEAIMQAAATGAAAVICSVAGSLLALQRADLIPNMVADLVKATDWHAQKFALEMASGAREATSVVNTQAGTVEPIGSPGRA